MDVEPLSEQGFLLTRAAASEAARAGRAEVDVEHVLLALLALGGPSAGYLLRAGADLAGLRRAAADLEAEDLRPLIDPRTLTRPDTGQAVGSAEGVMGGRLPVNARVRAVLDGLPVRAGQTSLLLALLADSPRAGRLLQRQGVDVPALRAALTAPEQGDRADDAAGPGGDVHEEPDLPAPSGWVWQHVGHRQVMPVSAADVWALVSDPARRPQWDPTCAAVHVAPDGSERVLTKDAGRDPARRQSVTRLVPGRAITWAREPGSGEALRRAGAAAASTTSVSLTDDGSHNAVLHLSTAWLVPSGRRWLRRPLTRMFRMRLRLLAQGIAQAAPGAAGHGSASQGARE